MDSLLIEGGHEIPGVVCPCGNKTVRNKGTVRRAEGTVPRYVCCRCSMQFSGETAPVRTARKPSIPLSDPGIVPECPKCSSTVRVKAGRNGGRQMFQCKQCRTRYVSRGPGARKTRYSQDIISAALNKVMSGMSYRKTAEEVNTAHGRDLSPNTIMFWTRKYTQIIKAHVDAILPLTGPVWSVDEAYVNVKRSPVLENKGHGNWLWSAIDPRTRYLLCTRIAEGSRTLPDAESVIREARKMSEEPDYMITDSLRSYATAAAKCLPRTAHIKTKAIRDGFTNMAIERYHNEIREKLKSCRGLHSADSAQIFMDLLRIHHNFVRPHMGLDGRTPAEESGVAVPEVRGAKYGALIRASAATGIASKLGRYSDHVEVVNRGDIVVTPKEWVENGAWNEINHILRGMGFRWLFTTIMRGWILFKDAPDIEAMPVAVRKRMPV
ncbi:transposase [Cenarchaeum symbiosum A]|uniref:Transposase n=1 Tax=Cenarchaeum symbiosum (strain A) TaxID=414004 RepID=A0RXS8_CENSY|nr:transposase [Cenarchaeum symbiosum A]